MFLSFIVPVYNAQAYLEECLSSLIHQDIPEEDYEIICVNDGSKDTSADILLQWQQKHHNIVVAHKENGGVVSARNLGLTLARGDYVWFVDSDDFIKENILGKLRQKIQDNPCDRLIIGCYIFDDVLSEQEQALSRRKQLPLNGPGQDSIVVRSLMRQGFLLEHGLFFSHPELTHGEDGMFMYEFCSFDPVSLEQNEAIYFYRIHSGSADTMDSVAGLQKKFRSYLGICRILREYYNSGRKNTRTANAYMTFLWFALLTTASLPPRESRKARKQLKKEKLFPSHRLPECDLAHSYMTDREDFVGKLYNKLYMNLHTRWGYAGIFLIRQLIRLKRSLKK